ncbi:hypothetical protein B1748_11560 [Paenibacillus sp. MY03]|uniref:TetR/AcrR family transcriptional regulator n=1 Tax=Paenibacillus sp. MY03 TaxID=302980 RepID=UPI000B3CB6CA|nr:TetR/AcrR family transcriptional regulator [Paenibacillus sp. MY03]OUS76720.1 hypothetical protein B1748_11560 [Paenibacillus sp. MY03]
MVHKGERTKSVQSERLQQLFLEAFEWGAGDPVRRKILGHAIEVFSRKGFAGTKIKDIAASAGFSQGYVYSYYKSKEELFAKIVELALDGAGHSVYQACQLPGSPLDRLYWLTEAYLAPTSAASGHWRLNLLLATSPDAIPEPVKAMVAERRGEPFKHLVPLIMEGQRLGELMQDDPLMLAIAYYSIVQGIALSRIQTEEGHGLPFPDAEIALRFLVARRD